MKGRKRAGRASAEHRVQNAIIVGAGVSGLQCARALLQSGIECIVLEQAAGLEELCLSAKCIAFEHQQQNGMSLSITELYLRPLNSHILRHYLFSWILGLKWRLHAILWRFF
jgi:glycine/D-amino acid oxidase-like deaminating enzyme